MLHQSAQSGEARPHPAHLRARTAACLVGLLHDHAGRTSPTRRRRASGSACARNRRRWAPRRSPSSCAPASRRCASSRASMPRSTPAARNLVLKQYLNIGFAADTPQGLVVPVIHGAGAMDVFALARALATLSEKARAGKLAVAEMQGGCFTISSLGGIGGTAFTPIVVTPEVAILGVSRLAPAAGVARQAFVPRLMLPLSLSYDHRVIDGAAAARFTTFLAQALADVAGLMGPPQ
ncbi:MAG: 2-oxo acid dehydrogenase subunit E2 [Steroidobacteraceae bacterium]